MKLIWNLISKKEFSYEGKIRVFLFLNCALFGMLGFLVWMIFKNITIGTLECALCFVGYPAFVLGYLRGVIFLCRQNEE